MAREIRLYVDHALGEGQSISLTSDQAHYLFGVMRLGVGDPVSLINGHDGEWQSTVTIAGKRKGILTVTDQSAPQRMPPDLWLLFAPIKKARTDFIVEKAAEMGAARICPVLTEYTNSDRMRRDKLQAHVIEAVEQCGGTFVPPVDELRRLSEGLDQWDDDRQILFCDESAVGEPLADLASLPKGPWAILIGPEGGFSPKEREMLLARKNTHPVSLGPRILRADTAAVAAMALWQSAMGDWA